MALTDKDVAKIRLALKPDFDNLKKVQQALEKGQRKIIRDLNGWTKFFDRDDTNLQVRVTKIENHLGFRSSEN